MHALLAILIVVLLVGIAIGLVLQHLLYSRLCTEHPKALEILAESSAGIMAFQRYLWKRQYLGLGGPRAFAAGPRWRGKRRTFSLLVATSGNPISDLGADAGG